MKFNGRTQEESSPKLIRIRYGHDVPNGEWPVIDNIKLGVESRGVYAGEHVRERIFQNFLHHLVSNEQVRPKNTAIKIWKRIQ